MLFNLLFRYLVLGLSNVFIRKTCMHTYIYFPIRCLRILVPSMGYVYVEVLRDLVPFIQFKKREKHPWGSGTFSKVSGFKPATLLKVTFLRGCFSRFVNFTNGTKSCKTSHIYVISAIMTNINLISQIPLVCK